MTRLDEAQRMRRRVESRRRCERPLLTKFYVLLRKFRRLVQRRNFTRLDEVAGESTRLFLHAENS